MITLKSPAKIDLFLRVVGKRPDGRPETAGCSLAVNLCDEISLAFAEEDTIHCSDPLLPAGYAEKIWEAVEVFKAKTGKKFSVSITIEKKIPPLSGLSGRSSNAATTLWALNKLNGEIVSPDDLQQWSSQIAYDTPFFFQKESSLSNSLSHPVWIASPVQKIPSDVLFNRFRFDEIYAREEFDEKNPIYFNDFEESAIAIFPKLALIKKRLLEAGAGAVVMTGPGSSLLCHGLAKPPALDHITFFRVKPTSRPEGRWY